MIAIFFIVPGSVVCKGVTGYHQTQLSVHTSLNGDAAATEIFDGVVFERYFIDGRRGKFVLNPYAEITVGGDIGIIQGIVFYGGGNRSGKRSPKIDLYPVFYRIEDGVGINPDMPGTLFVGDC